jgi:putative membrane protein insertion efficiency factor
MKKIILKLIRFYQFYSSCRPPSCRFSPTCSEYAYQVIQKDGPLRGCWKSIFRLLKCHPFHPGGLDSPDCEDKKPN